MYKWSGLIENKDNDKNTYYIGDSKYYKLGHEISKESVYKQYTYARNVIQWNIDLFMNGEKTEINLRDELTEGYNIIPNFFISAMMAENLSFAEKIQQTDRKNKFFESYQFKNRLFDRDTLLIFHYDVNFLHVVSLYARNNEIQKQQWKDKIHNKFREEIQNELSKKYDFYAMKEKIVGKGEEYIKSHFKDVLGKIYTPYSDKNIYSLALDKKDEYKEENKALILELEKHFFVEKCGLGENPEDKFRETSI